MNNDPSKITMNRVIVDIPRSKKLLDLWEKAVRTGIQMIFLPGKSHTDHVRSMFPDAVLASAMPEADNNATEGSANDAIAAVHDGFSYIAFSGGTTGEPKGILVNAANLNAYLEAVMPAYAISPCEGGVIGLLCHPGFDASVEEHLITLYARKRVAIAPQSALLGQQLFMEWVNSNGIDTLSMPTPLFDHLLAVGDISGSSRLKIIVGGDALLSVRAKSFLRRFPNAVLINSYGPTEATVVVSAVALTSSNVDQWTNTPIVPIGFPVKGVTFNTTEHGHLIIEGKQVANYYGKTEETAGQGAAGKRFVTRDFVQKRPDGAWDYLGRDDTLLKVHGKRINAGDLEHLLESRGIHCAIIADEGGERLGAVVDPAAKPDEAQFRGIVTEFTGLPIKIYYGAIPLTERSKRDLKKCRELLFAFRSLEEDILNLGTVNEQLDTVAFDSLGALTISDLLAAHGIEIDGTRIFGEHSCRDIAFWIRNRKPLNKSELLIKSVKPEQFAYMIKPRYSFGPALDSRCRAGQVYVTGGRGFIGRSICQANGWEPIGREEIDGLEGRLDRGDVVIHLAATVNHLGGLDSLIENNVQLPIRLKKACVDKQSRFIFVSTVDVLLPPLAVAQMYPDDQEKELSPKSYLKMLSNGYARSKALAEMHIAGEDCLILRSGFVGPGNPNDIVTMIIDESLRLGAAPDTEGPLIRLSSEEMVACITALVNYDVRGIVQIEGIRALSWREVFTGEGIAHFCPLDEWLMRTKNHRIHSISKEVRKVLAADWTAPLVMPEQVLGDVTK